MQAKFIFAFFLSISTFSFSQDSLVKIEGYAPDYVGKIINIYGVQDYLSQKETLLCSAVVGIDSLFKIEFQADKTQKIIISSDNNRAYMYAQPNAQYQVFLPSKNPYSPPSKSGNLVELSFNELSPADINYKILSFLRWNDEYIGRYYKIKKTDPGTFANKLDTFKIYVERAYKDEDDIYFLTYVKFKMAKNDDINFAGSRNRYEKYDFYLKPSPVFYNNDAYMNYVKNYYHNLIPRLSNEANGQVYMGVLKSSPTLIMRALGSEYALDNLRLREMVMIQALSEVYNSNDYPQTNLLTIFDSLENKALFHEHRIIARNIKARLTELVPGAASPDFTLSLEGDSLRKKEFFYGKYLYFHVSDFTSPTSINEIPLLKELHKKYSDHIEFLTVVVDSLNWTKQQAEVYKNISWKKTAVKSNDKLIESYKIRNFPRYILIDPQGYIVNPTSLGPTPDAQYETIEKTFYFIQRMNTKEKEFIPGE